MSRYDTPKFGVSSLPYRAQVFFHYSVLISKNYYFESSQIIIDQPAEKKIHKSQTINLPICGAETDIRACDTRQQVNSILSTNALQMAAIVLSALNIFVFGGLLALMLLSVFQTWKHSPDVRPLLECLLSLCVCFFLPHSISLRHWIMTDDVH